MRASVTFVEAFSRERLNMLPFRNLMVTPCGMSSVASFSIVAKNKLKSDGYASLLDACRDFKTIRLLPICTYSPHHAVVELFDDIS